MNVQVEFGKREDLHRKHLHLRTSVITSRIPKNKETICFFVFLYIKILVSEQGNTICEKTVEFSQIVDYEERQKGLS